MASTDSGPVSEVVTTRPPRTESLSSFPSGRDSALDVVRGWAILSMIASHVGSLTKVTAAMHLPFLVSAAEPFILTSGLVLGMRASREDGQRMPRAFYLRILKRAWMLLRVHYVLTFTMLVLHEVFGTLNAPRVEEVGGWMRAAWLVVTLRLQPLDYMNILPLYVVFVGFSPVVLEVSRRGLARLVLLVSGALWVFSQTRASIVPIPDPNLGPVVFSLSAWQFPFALGLIFGFYRARLPSPSRWLKVSVALAAGVLFIAAQFQRRSLRWVGLVLPAQLGFLIQKVTWGPVRALYSVCLIAVLHEGIRRFLEYTSRVPSRSVLVRAPLYVVRELERIGRRSLYCFLLHLVFALAASAAAVTLWPHFSQELLVIVTIVLFLELTRRNFAAKWVPE